MSRYTETLHELEQLIYALSHKANAAPMATVEGLILMMEIVIEKLPPSKEKTELHQIKGLMMGVVKQNRKDIDKLVNDRLKRIKEIASK